MDEKTAAYIQPTTLSELQADLNKLTGQSLVLAGGTDLMPKIRQRRTDTNCYISLCQLEELKKIEIKDRWLSIGAMVTHDMVVHNTIINKHFRGLQMACSGVGSQQIRNKGTLGGSLVNASPAGDIMPCVFLYGGEVEILNAEGFRRVPIEAYLTEDGRTTLQTGEILTAILLPIEEGRRSSFVKLGSRREVTIAQISLCASWREEDGNKTDLNGYVGAVDSRPIPFEGCGLLAKGAEDMQASSQAAEILCTQIEAIQSRRKRQSKLKITDAEKQYKKRAVRGIVCDLLKTM